MSVSEIDVFKLTEELTKLPQETSWLEFKHNNSDPKMIGEDISALANAAVLAERDCAYMIWGVANETHDIEGTDVDLRRQKVGNEELENWLRHQLSNNADFEMLSGEKKGIHIQMLRIRAAVLRPIAFENMPFVRIGSYTKKLHDYPEVQARLWDRLRNINFENQASLTDLDMVTAVHMLDASLLFSEAKVPEPTTVGEYARLFCDEKLLRRQDDGRYSVTNLGALLFARKISDFPRVSRKAVRIIQYRGANRMEMVREIDGKKGYAAGFENMIQFILAITPADEPIMGGLRKPTSAFPEIAIRELVANALIHQDLTITGAGPLIEVFSDRIEIGNPGKCLVAIERIVDCSPKSRNEDMAAIMRRMHICEEAGGGWDKAVMGCEEKHLPAPKMMTYEDSVRVTLSAKSDFSKMTSAEKLWACYLHACVLYVENQFLTNTSLRNRFGLGEESSASVSRLIKDAIDEKFIKVFDPETAKRYMKYVPFWA